MENVLVMETLSDIHQQVNSVAAAVAANISSPSVYPVSIQEYPIFIGVMRGKENVNCSTEIVRVLLLEIEKKWFRMQIELVSKIFPCMQCA